MFWYTVEWIISIYRYNTAFAPYWFNLAGKTPTTTPEHVIQMLTNHVVDCSLGAFPRIKMHGNTKCCYNMHQYRLDTNYKPSKPPFVSNICPTMCQK